MFQRGWVTLLCLVLMSAGCSDSPQPAPTPPADAGADAGVGPDTDAGTDAGIGTGTDAGSDAGADAGTDAGSDAGVDAGTDAGSDAGTNTDAGADAGTDAGSDGGTDTDAGTDGGPPPELPSGGGDWSQYRGGPEGTWVNPGTFTPEQARAVTPKWTADAGPGYTQPIIVGDSVYITTSGQGRVLAFNTSTGARRWARALDGELTDPCATRPNHPGFWAAPALANGTLYAASPDGTVYALDPATGDTVRASPVATTSNPPELIQSSPAASTRLGKLYVGVAAVFTCRHIPGRVISVDLATGESRSVTLTQEGRVGAAVWSSLSVDADTRRVFATTSDPVGQPLEEVPLSQSFVALDADTLEVLDHWQNPTPGPNANSDFGASPTLFTASDGTRLVAAANKDGRLYVLRRDRLSDGPLWTYQVARGGPDPLAGEGSLVAPTFAHGLLYAAGGTTPDDEPGAVVALEPLTGQVRWRHVTPGFVFAGMPAVGDVLVVVSNAQDSTRSWLELLDARTGRLLKTFETSGPTFAAPAVGRGLILWYPYSGQLQALEIPAP
jgi:outer membrane protein assembly factor BamB